MRGHHTDNNSPGNLKISGSSTERIVQTLIHGKRKLPVDLAVGEIKKALRDFANQVKNGGNWERKEISRKEDADY